MCCRIAEGDLTPETHPFEIDAPDIAGKLQAGQFVVFRADAREERMPPTVASWDRNKGTVPVLFLEAGRTTPVPANFLAEKSFANPSGSLGMPALIGSPDISVCAARKFAIAGIAPTACGTRQTHNKVIASTGLRTRDLLFEEDSLRSAGDELTAATTGTNPALVRVSDILELNVCALTIDEVAAAIAAARLYEQLEGECTR